MAGASRLEGVSLWAGAGSALQLAIGADAEVSKVRVTGPGPAALIDLSNARFTGRNLVMRSAGARGFAMLSGAQLSLYHSAIETGGGALVTFDPAMLFIDDTVISGSTGAGLTASGSITIRRSLFADNRWFGLEISSGRAELSDLVVRDSGQEFGGGISLQSVTASVARILIEQTHEHGLQVVGGDVTIEDAIVRDLLPLQPHVTSAPGISVFNARIVLTRARIEQVHGRGIEVSNTSERVEIRDLSVDGVGDSEQGAVMTQGFGVTLFSADAAMTRVEIANVYTTGIFASGGTVEIEDADVHDSINGNGIGAENVAHLNLRAIALERNGAAGLSIDGTTQAILGSIAISEGGAGADFGSSTHVDGSHLQVLGTSGFGLCVRDQADVTLSSVEIGQVVARGTIACRISSPPPGTGIVLNGTPSLDLSDFRLKDNAALGILVNRDASTTIGDGEILGSFVGVQLDPEVDPTSVMVRVRYQDNRSNFEVY